MSLKPEFEAYASACQAELKKLLYDTVVIPAPSGHEERRAAFIKDWMEKQGARGVFIDEALNVIWPVCDTGDNDLVVLMAHTDTVFPEETKLEIREEGDKAFCPGMGDDTARLAMLLETAKYFTQNNVRPKTGILFVANSCEEGLGNLKGSRKIMETYAGRVKQFVTYDGSQGAIVTVPVGSHRYKVTVRTEGGHSYSAFGNRNAIRVASSLIDSLYTVKVPKIGESKTTYNVGSISGGTSVNTIAQNCEFLYEYRSTDRECLAKMKDMFTKMVEAYRATGVEVEVELLGERPCMGEVDPAEQEKLIEAARLSNQKIGVEAKTVTGSTDANIPLSLGVPAICAGVGRAFGAHTLDEYILISGLLEGMRFSLDFVQNFFEE